jgi:hypothetical protein
MPSCSLRLIEVTISLIAFRTDTCSGEAVEERYSHYESLKKGHGQGLALQRLEEIGEVLQPFGNEMASINPNRRLKVRCLRQPLVPLPPFLLQEIPFLLAPSDPVQALEAYRNSAHRVRQVEVQQVRVDNLPT